MIVKGSSKCEPDVICCCCENFEIFQLGKIRCDWVLSQLFEENSREQKFSWNYTESKVFNVGYHAKFLYENQVSNWFSSDFKMSSISLIAPICLLKVNNRNTGTRCEICSVIDKDGVVVVSLFLAVNIFRTLFYC